MTLGQAIKAARKEAGLTQRALAEKIGVTRISVYFWEADRRKPSLGRLLRMNTFMPVVEKLANVE